MSDQAIDQKLQEAHELIDKGKTYTDIRKHFKDELSDEAISLSSGWLMNSLLKKTELREILKKQNLKHI